MMMSEHSLPQSIQYLLQVEQLNGEHVLSLLEPADLDTQGALFDLLQQESFWDRINPSLDHAVLDRLYIEYLLQCVIQGRESDWCESRYLACYGLNAIIRDRFQNNDLAGFTELQQALARLYRDFGEPVRDAVVNGCLEHLFDDPAIRAAFSDWQSDAVLHEAYLRGCQFSATS
ncbi:hypothetical protein C7S18_02860 [Ahniella affigens]|uniref:Uncharacterized protein n=1 Tax=Ahniella affigens TaxID=2021234 RepID=A0A2P1PMX4_9GAMM|nr:hypothetical protein [Ahniella affigens]AVP96196.1 hypothetical protein C7S18_02860 [Ahniella affigens]